MKLSAPIMRALKQFMPPKILNLFIEYYIPFSLRGTKACIKKLPLYYEIEDEKGKCIRVSRLHCIDIPEIVHSFEYYFSAVCPKNIDGKLVVDYSKPQFHDVIGYDFHPVIFPSFAEPVSTSNQYMEFAQITKGSVVLDLGAYSGFTSILFDRVVANDGRVIAVEADQINIEYIKENFFLYEKKAGRRIDLLEGAVWQDNNGLVFSSEGNMGSSAASIVGKYRGALCRVPSYTLSAIADKYNLTKIDFIKCDIEGGESVVFNDQEFFERFRPRIIIEPHIVDGIMTTNTCIKQLLNYGYQCKVIPQHGANYPLIECYPSQSVSCH